MFVLWNHIVEQRKYDLLRWEIVCKPLCQSGLEICLIENMNKVTWESGYGEWVIHLKGVGMLHNRDCCQSVCK